LKNIIISILITSCLFTGIVNGKEKKLPDKVEMAIENIITGGKVDTKAVVTDDNIKNLYDFILSAANDDHLWQIKPRRGAKGAAIIRSFNIPFKKVLEINLASGLSDAAFFYNVLRYSKKINLSPQSKKFFSETSKSLNTNESFETSYLSVECITPNLQSGAYYSYTNSRTITRANINGTEIMISISDMLEPSSFSMRGIPVGPVDDGVFYYSQKPGMNMPGVTWVKSQMYISSTISVYMEMPDNKTAVAMFSWQSAGWKGMNIIKSYHIYTVLQNTLKTFNDVFGNPKINVQSTTDIIIKINKMSPKTKNALYKEYCNYVRKWSYKKPKGLNPFRKSAIAKIFNEKSLNNMKQDYKDILIIQEFIRNLLGKPTWSAKSLLKLTF